MAKKILIIEDEERIANAFMKQLTMIGNFEVEIAGGGGAGLKAIEEGNFDLVLLDLVMTDMDGIEVLQNIRKDPEKYKNIAVIVLTNVTSETTKDMIDKLGVSKYIVKTSISPEELISQINEVLNNQQ